MQVPGGTHDDAEPHRPRDLPPQSLGDIERLAGRARQMLREALDAFVRNDLEAAVRVLRALGWQCTFFADNRACIPRYTEELRALGVEVQFHPWLADPGTRIWVADYASKPDNIAWLDGRKAHYSGGKHSPMGYGYAAYAQPQPGSLDFAGMREHVVLKGK